MRKIVLNYVELPKVLKKPLWRFWHNFIISRDGKDVVVTFMNYGFAGLNGDPRTVTLHNGDEPERYCAQLYDHAASHTNLEDKEVLEVGAGRGGGASYLTRYRQPKQYVGLDLSQRGIRFCNSYHQVPGLSFVRGDAEELPFPDDSFDAVLNVESSRCYGRVDRFFDEVKRVLRPGGDFLFTDMRWEVDVEPLFKQLEEQGLKTIKYEDITDNVVRALDIDNDRKRSLIGEKIPRPFMTSFNEFAGVRGSGRYESFASGAMRYFSALLQPV
jgi:SAM-dependent methyltransferase